MTFIQVADYSVHEEALALARKVGTQTATADMTGLKAPLEDPQITWIEQIWEQVEGAVRVVRREGKEAAQGLIDTALNLYADAKAELGSAIEGVTSALLERLSTFLRAVVDTVLKTMRAEIVFGNQTLAIKSVSISRSVSLSASFELSLEKVCSFAADGELSVQVDYEPTPAV